uniref:DDE_Tnp_1_7 domain-containing protein n=1 Tax=Strongyloides papillosus TaxID=174720 RepID=A0A0N5C1B1_STREA
MKSSKRNLISNEDNEINSDEESPIVLVSREEMEDQILEDLEEQQWDEEIDNVALRMDEMEIIHETEENFEQLAAQLTWINQKMEKSRPQDRLSQHKEVANFSKYGGKNPYELFLEISKSCLDHIFESTNAKFNENEKMSQIEFQGFIGTLLMISIKGGRSTSVRSIFSTHPLYDQYKFARCAFPRERFSKILGALTASNEQKDPTDKANSIRMLEKIFETSVADGIKCDTYFLDESQTGYRGRCSFICFNPSKSEKYGLKSQTLTSSRSRYVFKSELYAGKNNTFNNRPYEVVLRMSEALKPGSLITFDNWFSSVPLALALNSKKINFLATIRPNRKFLPEETKISKKVESDVEKENLPVVEESTIRRSVGRPRKIENRGRKRNVADDDVEVPNECFEAMSISQKLGSISQKAAYRLEKKRKNFIDKVKVFKSSNLILKSFVSTSGKNIMILSNAYSACTKFQSKTNLQTDYNCHMGGVDVVDQMINRHSIKRRSKS